MTELADMVKVETNIAWALVELLKTFFKANELQVTCEERVEEAKGKILTTLYYEPHSDTAYSITFMSTRHLGFENMLVDYLKRCGIPLQNISIGHQVRQRRDMDELDRQWLEHKKKIGL